MTSDLSAGGGARAIPEASKSTAGGNGASAATGRVLLVVNEDASRVSKGTRDEVVAALAGRDRVDVVEPSVADDAVDACRQAAEDGHRYVVAYGGDGTVSAAARGLIGTGVPLACIPGGFTNVFARILGVPRDPVVAARRIAAHPGPQAARAVSLGTIDGRPFLYAAGAGFSPLLMERLAAAGPLKGRLGPVYGGGQAIAVTARIVAGERPLMTIDAGGPEVTAVTAVAQNADVLTFYGPRPIRTCPGAALGPPHFGVAALRSARVRDVAGLVGAAFTGRAEAVVAQPAMSHWSDVRSARITAVGDDGVPIEADGDYIGRRRSFELGIASSKLLLLA